MKIIIPTFYSLEKDEKRRVNLRRPRRKSPVPVITDKFKFYYFGKDAESLNTAEESSIYRGTFRNLSSLGQYSTILNDKENPAKSSLDPTELRARSFGASYDTFSSQVSANRGFNTLETQKEYELYEKEKTYANFENRCARRRLGLGERSRRF